MPTILDDIVEAKRKAVEAAKAALPLNELQASLGDVEQPRDFYGAIDSPAPHGIHLIAEVKKASPSAGVLKPDYDPAAIARLYCEAGASAVSVLTDGPYFQGSLEHIARVKAAVPLPVLRKDFIIDPYQIYEARRHGADAVLLIAEVLSDGELRRFSDLATELGMTALIEVHCPERLDTLMRVVDFAPPRRRLLGINNRDLKAQQTDIATTGNLTAKLESKPLLVSESGIKTRADVELVAGNGADAILVGETLLRADSPSRKIHELLGIEGA